MLQEFLTQIEPALVSLAVATVIAILSILGKLLVKLTNWIVSKIGRENFEEAKSLAYGIWLLLEKDYPQLLGKEKRELMAAKLLARFPKLTQDQLDAINKEVNNALSWQTKLSEPVPCEPTPEQEAEFVVNPTPTEV